MAITNQDRVGKAMDLLRAGLAHARRGLRPQLSAIVGRPRTVEFKHIPEAHGE